MRRVTRFLAGALIALVAALTPTTTRAVELEVVGEPPLVVHATHDRLHLAADLAAKGPEEMTRISVLLGLPAPARIDVFLLPRQGEESPEEHGLPPGPDWASGYVPEGQPVVILRTAENRGDSGNDVLTTLSHELTHSIMGSALGARHQELPAWMREGVATHAASEWRLLESVHVVGLALSGRYIPLFQLETAFQGEGPRVQWAYLEAFAFVNWLVDRHGPDSLRTFFARYREGMSFRRAFVAAFGETPEAAEEGWEGEFLWRYRWLPIVTSSSTLWAGVVALFVVVGVRKRRRAGRLLAQWQEEDEQRGPPPLTPPWDAGDEDGQDADDAVDGDAGHDEDGDADRPRRPAHVDAAPDADPDAPRVAP